MTRIGIPFEVLVKLARTDRTVASVLRMWQNGAIVSLESALILMVETLSSQNQHLLNAYLHRVPVDLQSPDLQSAAKRFDAYWRQEQDRQRRAADVATRVRTEEMQQALDRTVADLKENIPHWVDYRPNPGDPRPAIYRWQVRLTQSPDYWHTGKGTEPFSDDDLRVNRYQILNMPSDASSVSVTQSSQSDASG